MDLTSLLYGQDGWDFFIWWANTVQRAVGHKPGVAVLWVERLPSGEDFAIGQGHRSAVANLRQAGRAGRGGGRSRRSQTARHRFFPSWRFRHALEGMVRDKASNQFPFPRVEMKRQVTDIHSVMGRIYGRGSVVFLILRSPVSNPHGSWQRNARPHYLNASDCHF